MVGGREWGWRKKNGGKDTRQHGEDGERERRCGKKGRYRYRLTMTIDDGSNKVVRDGTAVQLDKQPNSIELLSRDRPRAFRVSISSPSRQQQGAVDTTSTTNETFVSGALAKAQENASITHARTSVHRRCPAIAPAPRRTPRVPIYRCTKASPSRPIVCIVRTPT